MFEEFREALLILISTPVYAVVIGLEMLMSYVHQHHNYSKKGTIENSYLMLLNMGLDILMRGICLFILNYFFQYHVTQLQNPWL